MSMYEDFRRPFSDTQMLLAATIARRMLDFGMGPDDVIAAAEELVERLVSETKGSGKPSPDAGHTGSRPVVRCPECGGTVSLSPVNVSRCTRIGGPWRTSLMCLDASCRWTELSKKTMEEVWDTRTW